MADRVAGGVGSAGVAGSDGRPSQCSWRRPSRDVGPVQHDAPQGQKTANSGTRPGLTPEPAPQASAAPRCPDAGVLSVATPALAAPTADGLDSSTQRFLTSLMAEANKTLEAKHRKKEEEEEQQKADKEAEDRCSRARRSANLLFLSGRCWNVSWSRL